jgi:hypothetical protein
MEVVMRTVRIVVSTALAFLVAVGLRRLVAGDPHVSPPPALVVAAVAVALAVGLFASRLAGALLALPAALACLPFRGHPAGLLTAVAIAVLAVGEVQLWSIWWPVTVLPGREMAAGQRDGQSVSVDGR